MNRVQYDDFYVVYLDSSGNILYPSDIEEVKIIKELMKGPSTNNCVYSNDGRLCFKMRVKRKNVDGQIIQIVELSNITEYIELLSKASLDEVTHLNNRRMVTYDFLEYIEYAAKTEEDFALIIADVDDFKSINDTYGHPVGDVVLSEISRMFYCNTRHNQGDGPKRDHDIVGRYGGDEFFALLKKIDFSNANKKTETIIENIRNHHIPIFRENNDLSFISPATLSVGFYHVTSEELLELLEKGNSIEEIANILYTRCDEALAISKRNGKDRMTIYGINNILEKRYY